ncbi:uncharacterized protein AKAW2_50306A [Aspergillus luchuensis]|uniref:Uncharacterized protein n=1 Tax=Aspergillus kawachii TaxID=1069201 RepID=A0A7R7ZZC1_ASPKA|nr:uncharacterized protein AKAW2_50306A [Aspergillus luchuensis]BCR99965.1 hypothetical protein AKAW2_50306A [Aspergillus luchuensis]
MAARHRSLLLPEALGNLRRFSNYIQRREALKPHQERRLKEGFTVLYKVPDKQKAYRDFLFKIQNLCGNEGDAMVALCILGLGKNTIKRFKEDLYTNLPYEIASMKEDLWNGILNRISRKPIHCSYRESHGYLPIQKFGYFRTPASWEWCPFSGFDRQHGASSSVRSTSRLCVVRRSR